MIVKFENIKLDVHPNKEHEWVLETSLVAKGYEVDAIRIQQAIVRRKEDLIEGKHYIRGYTIDSTLKKNAQPNQIFWTKNGVVRLGFFLRCEKAKVFRDWAEDLILGKNPNLIQMHEELNKTVIDENEDLKRKLCLKQEEFEKLLGQEGFRIGVNENIHNIKMYRTISNFFESRGMVLKNELVIDVSKEAKNISRNEGYPVMFLPSDRFGKVNLYHEDCIQSAYFNITDNWIN